MSVRPNARSWPRRPRRAAGVRRRPSGRRRRARRAGAGARGSSLSIAPGWFVAGDAPGTRAVSMVNLSGDRSRRRAARPRRRRARSHDGLSESSAAAAVAVALMSAAGEACGEAGLGGAGRAFREMTRLASSPQDLWRGILATNADFVGEALAAFARKLPPGAALSSGSHRRGVRRSAEMARAAGAHAAASSGVIRLLLRPPLWQPTPARVARITPDVVHRIGSRHVAGDAPTTTHCIAGRLPIRRRSGPPSGISAASSAIAASAL